MCWVSMRLSRMNELNDIEIQKIRNLLRTHKGKDKLAENWFIDKINEFRNKLDKHHEVKPNEAGRQ